MTSPFADWDEVYRQRHATTQQTTVTPGRKLSVLHVVSHLPPDRIGGVGEVVATVHDGLSTAGHDSWVLTTGTSSDENVRRICETPDRFLVASASFVDEALKADIVHFHHGEALLLMERLHRHSNPPHLVLTLHVDAARIAEANTSIPSLSGRSGLVQSRLRDPLKRRLDQRATKLADRVTFISHGGAIEMMGHAPTPTPVVIYNGVAKHPETGATATSTDLLFVGTAGPRKGIDLLPEILRQIRADRPDSTLRIIGFTPESEPELVDAFAEAGCGNAVDWAGTLDSSEILPHYRSAHILIVPSRYEGLPMVILEAGSVGLPAVATDVGGTREAVLDGKTGRLVPTDVPRAMADASLELLSDDATRRQMGAAIRQHVRESFSIERQVDGYINLYDELCSAKEPAG